MSYSVSGAAGKRRVKFTCPTCTASLECPLAEAGQVFDCPTCRHRLKVPGVAEQQQEATEAKERRARQSAAERAAQEQAEEESRIAQAQAAAEAAAREKKRQERELARADRNAAGGVPAWVLIATVAGLSLAGWVLVYRPLQGRISTADREIDQLRDASARSAARLEGAISSLRSTVNQNAEAANETNDALASLRRTVNQNAETANFNNRLRR